MFGTRESMIRVSAGTGESAVWAATRQTRTSSRSRLAVHRNRGLGRCDMDDLLVGFERELEGSETRDMVGAIMTRR